MVAVGISNTMRRDMSSGDWLKFGVFFAPHHPHNADPALQLRQDLRLIAEIDDMGFDEVWVGEHHSNGSEIISAPDLFIAAAAEHTKHVKLGTGVVSMSYHHPFITASRIAQLDNMTRGRIIFGTGPGKLPLDAHMMGIDTRVQRRRQREALEAVIPLLNGETVSMETDWFTLQDAALHLLPYNGPGTMEIAAASIASPSGPEMCGTLGLSLLSLAAGTAKGFDALPVNWQAYESVSAAHGHEARRDTWRILEPMFLAEDRAELDRIVARRLPYAAEYSQVWAAPDDDLKWTQSPQATIDHWRDEGMTIFGKGTFGGPEEAIGRIETLREQTGGFGTFLILLHDLADFQATVRNFELFASEVIPHFRSYRNQNRVDTLQFAKENVALLAGSAVAAEDKAKEDFQRGAAAAWQRMSTTS
jgi:limonene 1,2-monooxygenase